MPSRAPVFRPAGAPAAGAADRQRGSAAARGYRRRWRRAREWFLNGHPVCVAVGCGRAATDVDHRIPHRGDQALFWDQSNWQALCHECHSAKTARGA